MHSRLAVIVSRALIIGLVGVLAFTGTAVGADKDKDKDKKDKGSGSSYSATLSGVPNASGTAKLTVKKRELCGEFTVIGFQPTGAHLRKNNGAIKATFDTPPRINSAATTTCTTIGRMTARKLKRKTSTFNVTFENTNRTGGGTLIGVLSKS